MGGRKRRATSAQRAHSRQRTADSGPRTANSRSPARGPRIPAPGPRTAAWLLTLLLGAWPSLAAAVPVRNLAEVRGVRPNQLIGYGLVVGLAGTGDRGQARFTLQSTAAMLRRLGATVSPDAIRTKNAAAVIVTATLPPGAAPGTRIDVTVSSLGNATSLVGGTLLQTPLLGADRRVYAVAQGPLVVGGFSAGGRSGSSVQLNHVTAARVPSGAIVERPAPSAGLSGPALRLSLRRPSFETAARIAEAIDEALGEGTARALGPGTVEVKVPEAFAEDRVGLVARIGALEVEPEQVARVVVDERTGTVVIGAGVRVAEVAIAQGGLQVEVSETPAVSQPGPLSGGRTAVVPQTEVQAAERPGTLRHLPAGARLADVVAALNALGATPRQLVVVLESLRAAGALQADLEVR